jgi:hypothetical protein
MASPAMKRARPSSSSRTYACVLCITGGLTEPTSCNAGTRGCRGVCVLCTNAIKSAALCARTVSASEVNFYNSKLMVGVQMGERYVHLHGKCERDVEATLRDVAGLGDDAAVTLVMFRTSTIKCPLCNVEFANNGFEAVDVTAKVETALCPNYDQGNLCRHTECCKACARFGVATSKISALELVLGKTRRQLDSCINEISVLETENNEMRARIDLLRAALNGNFGTETNPVKVD